MIFLSVTFFKKRAKKHRDNMDDIQDNSWELYILGDKSLVPVGVDEERYSLRFLENSRRLFASQEEHLEVMRILSGSGGRIPITNVLGLLNITDDLQRRKLI